MRGRVVAALLVMLPCKSAGADPLKFETHQSVRPDGSILRFALEAEPNDAPREAIIILQGTGCNPVMGNPNLARAAADIAPQATAVLIDNYAAGSDDAGRKINGCTADFWGHATLQQRTLDVAQVVSELRRMKSWNGHVVIFGGSEGGAVAALAAPLIPEARAIIVFSSGTGFSVGDLVKAALPPDLANQAPRIFLAADADPTGGKWWAGLSYRWWADAYRIVPARALLLTPAPVLLVQGALDKSSPVAAARAGRDLLDRAGKHDVTYREFPNYDHRMVDEHGVDHLDEVLRKVGAWLNRRPDPLRQDGVTGAR